MLFKKLDGSKVDISPKRNGAPVIFPPRKAKSAINERQIAIDSLEHKDLEDKLSKKELSHFA